MIIHRTFLSYIIQNPFYYHFMFYNSCLFNLIKNIYLSFFFKFLLKIAKYSPSHNDIKIYFSFSQIFMLQKKKERNYFLTWIVVEGEIYCHVNNHEIFIETLIIYCSEGSSSFYSTRAIFMYKSSRPLCVVPPTACFGHVNSESSSVNTLWALELTSIEMMLSPNL